jgi:sulfite exporter TauE/SafE
MATWALTAAFLLGLGGSAHCLGMCGPLVVMMPFKNFTGARLILAQLSYHLSRALAYAAMGLVFGLFGQGIGLFSKTQHLSLFMGAVVIVMVFFPKIIARLSSTKFFAKISQKHGRYLRQVHQTQSLAAMAALGFFNGLLPCGLSYAAIGGAIALGHTGQAVLFMLIFGIGTSPALIALGSAQNLVKPSVRLKFSKLSPIMGILLGVLLILRGLDLGIPYLSPKIEKSCHNTEEVSCCDRE